MEKLRKQRVAAFIPEPVLYERRQQWLRDIRGAVQKTNGAVKPFGLSACLQRDTGAPVEDSALEGLYIAEEARALELYGIQTVGWPGGDHIKTVFENMVEIGSDPGGRDVMILLSALGAGVREDSAIISNDGGLRTLAVKLGLRVFNLKELEEHLTSQERQFPSTGTLEPSPGGKRGDANE